MSAPDGAGNGSGRHAAVPGARPLILVSYRPGLTEHHARTVHFVPLPVPTGSEPIAATALCGLLLRADQVETVPPGEGVPCSWCAVSHLAPASHLAPNPPPPHPPPAPPGTISADIPPPTAAAIYRAWGWPVTLRGEQVWLALEQRAVAVLVPVPLATQVSTILASWRCAPAVLAHPDAPEHQVFLAGEPYGVALGWPPGVQRITGSVLLPPTLTLLGPLTWVYPPQPDTLRLSREIDLAAALRTTHSDPPPAGEQPPPH